MSSGIEASEDCVRAANEALRVSAGGPGARRDAEKEDWAEYSWLRFGVEAVAMPPNPRPVRLDSVCRVVVV